MYFNEELRAADLPQLLQEGMAVAHSPAQADMLLLSLLTASGYAMPNYHMRAGVPARLYEPSLMTVVLAPPACGKGIMQLGRRLLQPLHDRLRGQTEEQLASASAKEAELVAQRMVFVPGNCSSNALLQILNDNAGRGCMIETEIDVVSQIWRRDYGNYSTLLRQAFEHETVSKARKTKSDPYLEVKHPSLCVLLSGTANQLQPLLTSRDNGLASRFLCYVVEDLVPFDRAAIINPEEESTDDVGETYSRLSTSITRMYDWLAGQKGSCEWRLTPAQAEEMRATWEDNYVITLCQLGMPASFDPVVKRMAVSIQRIGMILSMLRYWESVACPLLDREEAAPLPATLDCDDRDFASMLALANVLTEHAIAIHEMLPAEESECYIVQSEQADAALQLLDRLPDKFTTREAIEAGAPAAERSIRNYLVLLQEQKQVLKTGHGQYQKIPR